MRWLNVMFFKNIVKVLFIFEIYFGNLYLFGISFPLLKRKRVKYRMNLFELRLVKLFASTLEILFKCSHIQFSKRITSI